MMTRLLRLSLIGFAALLCAAAFLVSSALADTAPNNGTNTSPFTPITSFTDLVACVRLDGSRDKDRGSVRFIEVVGSTAGQDARR